jgi:hypothetical protein
MTVTYVISYALLWPDTWQIACGLVAAWLLTPKLAPTGAGVPTVVVSYGMLAAIGYAASGMILRPLFRRLHAWMLRRRRA